MLDDGDDGEELTPEKAKAIVTRAKKNSALAIANLDPEQQDAYRRAMTNRAIVDGSQMIETLIEISQDKTIPPNVRVTAASLVLERAIGKPVQEIKIDDESKTKHLSTSELIELAGRLGIAVGFAKARDPGPIIEAETGTLRTISEAD